MVLLDGPAAPATSATTARGKIMTVDVAKEEMTEEEEIDGTANATATTTTAKEEPPPISLDEDDDRGDHDENGGAASAPPSRNQMQEQQQQQQQQLVVVDEFPYIVNREVAGDGEDDDATRRHLRRGSLALKSASGFSSRRESREESSRGEANEDDDDDEKGDAREEITFLVEIAKATIPKRRRRGGGRGGGYGGGGNNSTNGGGDDESSTPAVGMHCTAYWVGPVNPSGRRRRERTLHRTRTLGIKKTDVGGGGPSIKSRGSSDSGSFPFAEGWEEEVVEEMENCTEHVFTLNDASLFLFRTSMKQLVNASLDSNSMSADDGVGDDDVSSCADSGGLRFDIFETPLDVLHSVVSTILADNVADQEANAMTDGEMSSSSPSSSLLFNNTYRLVGSVFLTPDDILSYCDERRFECDMMENWRGVQRRRGDDRGSASTSRTKRVNGGRLALRIRVASEFDVAFMRPIMEMYDEDTVANGVNARLRDALIRTRNVTDLEPAQLVTEIDESLLTAENTIMAFRNLTPVATESVRYMMSNDNNRRLMVKPYPDPVRPKETMWLTEEDLRRECYGPSTNWIQAGAHRPDSLGRVYLEVLKCKGLPNTDAGGSVGNKTDAFVSVVYGDVMVQTEVINDSLSPMWMPWSSRAFVFQMVHPSAAVHIGVADYDFGPLDHECIGRASICLGRFHPGTVYTLSYNLYDSPNLTEKGEVMGIITVRLRMEIVDEKRYLMEGYRAPEQRFVNSQNKKTHRIAKYCVDGPHDDEVFEMSLFRSHIRELFMHKRYMIYAISDASRSLIFWRGQVKVGNIWLPLHSAVVFLSLTRVVENPHLLPSFFLFGCGWILLANMLLRVSHPSPWHRGHSFAYYWKMMHGHCAKKGVRIKSFHGHEEASKLMEKWEQRLADEDANYAKQLDFDAKIQTITEGANVRTRKKAKSAIVDPISAIVGSRLLPYQQLLSRYCKKVRYVRSVLTWNESIVSFFLTLAFFGAAFVALFVPWRFLLLWTSRLAVWIFLGPWMRLMDLFFHEESVRQKAKAYKRAMDSFHQQHTMAQLLRENALKMKAFRVKLFGKYITTIPGFNLTLHEDVPLPESSAEPHSEEEVKIVKFIPSQELSGAIIPITDNTIRSQSSKQSENDCFVNKYRKRVTERKLFDSAREDDDLDEGYEIIGNEDGLVCVHSTFAELGALDTTKMALTQNRSKSERDLVVTDKAIQLAIQNQLQPLDTSKSKWIFSASIKLSLRKEMIEGGGGAPTICADTTSNNMIEQMDSLAEEGVEIVPFLGSLNDDNAGSDLQTTLVESSSDHVSVFYFKEAKVLVDECTETTSSETELNENERQDYEDRTRSSHDTDYVKA